MQHLPCSSTFRIYEPHEEFRAICPQVLVICQGNHPHFIPLPSKTPPSIRATILKLLEALGPDLPDTTPRRFLRHPITRTFLLQRFPGIQEPTLMDLHVSLANREHLRSYIVQAVQEFYPKGTGWEGNAVSHHHHLSLQVLV